MSAVESPSPVLACFVHAVRRELPRSEQAKLEAHEAAVAASTSRGDARRARRCAEWAIEMSAGRSRSHPRWRELHEAHEVWKETWFGVEFGLADLVSDVVGPAMPVRDVELEWTEDAVAVAKALGEEDGWDRVPWEELLVELIGIDASATAD